MDYKNKLSILIDKIARAAQIDLRYFIKNGFWVAVREVFTLAMGLLVSVAFTRLTTKELYGNYELILSIFSLVSIVSISGLNAAIIRSVARGYEGSYPKAVKASFSWSFLGSLIIFIIGLFYFIYQDKTIGIIFLVSSILFPFIYGINYWQALFSGQKRFDLATKFASLQSVVSGLIMGLVIFLFPDKLIIIILAHFLLSSGFNILFFKKSLSFLRNNKKDKEIISYGYFLTKINVLATVANNLDKIIIGIFLSPADLAVYAIGVNLARKFLNLTKSFLATATPKIAQKNTLNRKAYFGVFIFFSIISVILYFLFPIVIPVLFSQKYESSIILSQIVIIFLPFYVINLLYKNHILFYLKDKRILFKESIIFPVAKMLLMTPLLFFFGVKGLAFLLGFQFLLDTAILYTLYLNFLKRL